MSGGRRRSKSDSLAYRCVCGRWEWVHSVGIVGGVCLLVCSCVCVCVSMLRGLPSVRCLPV